MNKTVNVKDSMVSIGRMAFKSSVMYCTTKVAKNILDNNIDDSTLKNKVTKNVASVGIGYAASNAVEKAVYEIYDCFVAGFNAGKARAEFDFNMAQTFRTVADEFEKMAYKNENTNK